MEPVRDIELYQGLAQALGPDVATALIERLPPEPVQEVATKTDLGRQDLLLKSELVATRQELKRDMAELRQEVKGDIAVLDQRMTGEFGVLRQEIVAMKHEFLATMRGEMIAAIHTQGRQLAATLGASLVGLSGLAFAIANLAN